MIKKTNRFSPEVRARAVRMVLEHEEEYSSRWAVITSISGKIGGSAPTLHEWIRRDEALKPEIERIFDANRRVYGVHKLWHQMKREGFSIARCTVERLMRDSGYHSWQNPTNDKK